jgi:hypothetical protein
MWCGARQISCEVAGVYTVPISGDDRAPARSSWPPDVESQPASRISPADYVLVLIFNNKFQAQADED